MPEGDTIWRTAARLQPALAGKVVARFDAARSSVPGPPAGTVIDAVEAKGKYLLVHFGNGQTLETHMKMTGSWHLYRTGERWGRSRRSARVEIETTEGWIAVCFQAPVVELVRRRGGPGHLGPDLTAPAPDLELATDRFSVVDGATPVGVALLDQRICCGVGNVFKSEVLHANRLAPRVSVEELDRELRGHLVDTAHRMLRANLGSGRRVTVPNVPGGLAVYGRRGEPCFRCGVAVERIVQGEHARSTYWCPGCQDRPTDRHEQRASGGDGMRCSADGE
jgi:endonuclease-8